MNIYKENYAELRSFEGDMGVQLDAFDAAHGLPYDALARAEYKKWRAEVTGVPELLSAEDKALLGI
jgi:hypothetical protein